jgi:hypothetical protein
LPENVAKLAAKVEDKPASPIVKKKFYGKRRYGNPQKRGNAKGNYKALSKH